MMELSEAEIEARLSDLRRRREALDREIADHVLYLELGRRLRGAGPAPAQSEERASELHEPPEAVSPRAPAAIRTMPAAPEPPQRVP
ncbi:hypothetical protein FV222_26290, partial [Methylobacterium sp. WL103]